VEKRLKGGREWGRKRGFGKALGSLSKRSSGRNLKGEKGGKIKRG